MIHTIWYPGFLIYINKSEYVCVFVYFLVCSPKTPVKHVLSGVEYNIGWE